ncbi:hypothetical protein AB0H57_32565 [Micromonospora sp. NPDC050686]|uniref:hypothetical protein n=1 Tax=Micromonospora sp. NPDC050686 TaxID=3154631 RepID=UPI0033F288D3
MSYFAHGGHEHPAALSFSVTQIGVLLVLVALALILNGDLPKGWRASPSHDEDRVCVRRFVAGSAVGVAGLGLMAPLLLKLTLAVTGSPTIAQIVAYGVVAVTAAAIAAVVRRRQQLVLGLLGLLGYIVALQLSMGMSNGIGPAAALAALTTLSVSLPGLPWLGQLVRLGALAAAWALLSVVTQQQWLGQQALAFLAVVTAAVAAVIPLAIPGAALGFSGTRVIHSRTES